MDFQISGGQTKKCIAQAALAQLCLQHLKANSFR